MLEITASLGVHGNGVPRVDRRRSSAVGHHHIAEAGSRIIVLTAFSGDDDVERALRAGACSYLLKDTPRPVLVDAIRTAFRKKNRAQRKSPESSTQQGPVVGYSARELEIMRMVAVGRKNREIAEALYISDGTVKNQIAQILEKLNARDRTDLVLKALRLGLIKLER